MRKKMEAVGKLMENIIERMGFKTMEKIQRFITG